LLGILISIVSFAQSEKADQELQALADELKTVGLAVAVVKKGEIIYARNFGWQDVEKQIPLSDNSILSYCFYL
jgi:CubicO group peptidase (beta-lactamase class C family)